MAKCLLIVITGIKLRILGGSGNGVPLLYTKVLLMANFGI